VERLDDVPLRGGGLSPADGVVVGVARQVDDRHIAVLAQATHSLHAVQIILAQADIDQHEVRLEGRSLPQRLSSRRGDRRGTDAVPTQTPLDVPGGDAVVLNDQDVRIRHPDNLLRMHSVRPPAHTGCFASVLASPSG